MAAKKRTGRRYGKGAAKKVGKTMSERKRGTLRSGRSGKKVTSRKQSDRDRSFGSASQRIAGSEEEDITA